MFFWTTRCTNYHYHKIYPEQNNAGKKWLTWELSYFDSLVDDLRNILKEATTKADERLAGMKARLATLDAIVEVVKKGHQ